MKYITGIHALNLPCSLNTCGDWHQSAIQWQNPQMRESNTSFFKEYGLEKGHKIPQHKEDFVVANTIRALLDLLYESNFPTAQGMRDDFICNDDYNSEVFSKVYEMRYRPNWEKIDAFMRKEYKLDWIKFMRGKENENNR